MTPAKSTANSGRVRLGELLVKAGVITDTQLKTALQEQKQWGGKLGDILVRLKYVSEDIFVRALSKQLGLTRADLNGDIPLEALAMIPAEVAEEYEIVPCAVLDDGKTLAIATADPLNLTVVDYVRSITKLRVVPQVASATSIRAAIAKLYQTDKDLQLEIVTNADDQAFGQSAGLPSKSGLDLAPAPRVGTTTSPGFRPVGTQSLPPPPPPSHTTNPNLTPLPRAPMAVAAQQYSTPATVAPMPNVMPMGYGYPSQMPVPGSGQPMAMSGYGQPMVDDNQRREAVALKALVELLVQKGVISLDEYLARLKR